MTAETSTETPAAAVARRLATFIRQEVREQADPERFRVEDPAESTYPDGEVASSIAVHETDGGTTVLRVGFREDTGFTLSLVTVVDGKTRLTETRATTLPGTVTIARSWIVALLSS